MNHNQKGGAFRSLFGLVLFGSLAIGAYFLISEHRAHIFAGKWTAPALLIAFIGLHFLMHAGHGGHSSRDQHRPSRKEPDDER